MKLLYTLTALLTCALPTYADTIVGRKGGEVNGRVTYETGTFTIVARVNGVQQTYHARREDISEISFNDRMDNNSTPPWIQMRPDVRTRAAIDNALNQKRDRLYTAPDNPTIGELQRIDTERITLSTASASRRETIKLVLE
jgi:hypothetical protein